jgi:hypothetical protein
MLKLWIAIFVLMTSVAFAQSQNAPDNQPAREQAAKPTQPDQRGTDKEPLSVKILPGEQTKEQAEKENRDRHEQEQKALVDKRLADDTQRLANSTDELARYTKWLVAVTLFLFFAAIGQIVLFYVQLKYMKTSVGDAHEAAVAAKASAESLPIIEGAYVFPNILNVTIADSFLGFSQVKELRQNRIKVEFEIRNFGKTPAIIQSCRADLVHRDPQNGWLRAVDVDTRQVTKIIMGTGDADIQEPAVINDFKREEWLSVTSRNSYLSFVGSIVYLDIFGDRWEFPFDWKYDAASQRLIPDNQPRRKTQQRRLEADTGRYGG